MSRHVSGDISYNVRVYQLFFDFYVQEVKLPGKKHCHVMLIDEPQDYEYFSELLPPFLLFFMSPSAMACSLPGPFALRLLLQ